MSRCREVRAISTVQSAANASEIASCIKLQIMNDVYRSLVLLFWCYQLSRDFDVKCLQSTSAASDLHIKCSRLEGNIILG